MTPVCPYCRTPIDSDENRQDCSGCGTPHHADCYAENGGCTVFGCAQAPADEPKLTVTGSEAAQAVHPLPVPLAAPHPIVPDRPVTVARPASVLGLSDPVVLHPGNNNAHGEVVLSAPAPFLAAAPAPAREAAPPPPSPPSDTTSVAPPPPPDGVVIAPAPAAASYPMSAAEMYANYHPPKSRVTFVLLGVFLGALGVHNFYAGYVRKAVWQLLLTVVSCGYGSLVSWAWAVIEVCSVKQDSEGVQFS